MIIPCLDRKHRSKLLRAVFFLLAVAMLLVFSGAVFGASGGESGGGKGWVATDTWKVLNFAVLAAALIYLLRKPVSQALNDRIKGIKEQLGELEAQKKKAEAELAEYNEKFKQLDQEAEKLIAQYIQQGEDAKARIIKEAEATAGKLEDQARRNIEHEFKKAKEKLQEEVLEKAMAQAEEIIKARISGDDHVRLVDEYLEKVVA